MSMKKWRTLSSKYIISNRWIRLRSDTCEAPDGHIFDDYYVLEFPGWANCVVLSEDLREITLLKHYRHGIDDFVLEIPGGILDEGEDPKTAMIRELKEEIGLSNAQIDQVGVTYPNPDKQNNLNTSFVVVGGDYGENHLEPGDTFETVKMPLDELLDKLGNQEITMQALHVSAIFLALTFLKKQGKL